MEARGVRPVPLLIKRSEGNPTVASESPADTWTTAQPTHTAKDPVRVMQPQRIQGGEVEETTKTTRVHRTGQAEKACPGAAQPSSRLHRTRMNINTPSQGLGGCTPSRRKNIPGAAQPSSRLRRPGRSEAPRAKDSGAAHQQGNNQKHKTRQ